MAAASTDENQGAADSPVAEGVTGVTGTEPVDRLRSVVPTGAIFCAAIERHAEVVAPLVTAGSAAQRLHSLHLLQKMSNEALGGLAPQLCELAVIWTNRSQRSDPGFDLRTETERTLRALLQAAMRHGTP